MSKFSDQAARLTAGRPAQVQWRTSRFAKDMDVADMDDAMEALGYKFAGWRDHRTAIFRFAEKDLAAEKSLAAARLFATEAEIYAGADRVPDPATPSSTHSAWLTLTRDGLVLGHLAEAVLPFRLLTGYVVSPQGLGAAFVVNAPQDGAPPPIGFVFPLDEGGRETFRTAVEETALKQLTSGPLRVGIALAAHDRRPY